VGFAIYGGKARCGAVFSRRLASGKYRSKRPTSDAKGVARQLSKKATDRWFCARADREKHLSAFSNPPLARLRDGGFFFPRCLGAQEKQRQTKEVDSFCEP
jgi:hypothetical protein